MNFCINLKVIKQIDSLTKLKFNWLHDDEKKHKQIELKILFTICHRMVFAQNMLLNCLFPSHILSLWIHTYIQLPLKYWPYFLLPVECEMKRKKKKFESSCPERKIQHRITCIRPMTPHESILLATLTVLLQISYCLKIYQWIKKKKIKQNQKWI